MSAAPLAAFAALLSFDWHPDEEQAGAWLALVSFVGFPDYELAAVTVCETRDPIWEQRIAWDIAADLRRTEAAEVPFRCASAFAPVVCAALRAGQVSRP